jgi:prefoldin subunit 5
MPLPLLPIFLGLGLGASLTANIAQGLQNRKLRKQIEMLLKTIENLQNDINEMKKEMRALKLWSFKQRYILSKEIKKLKGRKEGKTKELKLLLEEAKEVA